MSRPESPADADMEVEHPVRSKFVEATEIEDVRPQQAVGLYEQVIAAEDPSGSLAKVKEQAIYNLGALYARLGHVEALRSLLVNIRPFFSTIPKGKTAKIVRTLIDMVGRIPNSEKMQAELCSESIEWCIREKRTFLKQRIQARLATLWHGMKEYKPALSLIAQLVREVKKIDDKLLMVEVELIESRIHYSLHNVPKAKGALTAARSNSNAIYCPPLLQAAIDLQSGILCAEERDYKTGFSYFYEAFEGFNTANTRDDAVRALKYMILCKIMTDTPADAYTIIHGKAGIQYVGRDMEAMKAIADAYKERSIHALQRVFEDYKEQLVDDPIVYSHLNQLYEKLLEQNYLRVLEPFSRVQITHVAKLVDLPVEQVEAKLSEMILDGKLRGILDQGSGDLIVFDEPEEDQTYAKSLEAIKELGGVVDRLYTKAKRV